MSIEAMKQALEALESFREISDFTPAQAVHAITALRTAIAEAEKQEPVAEVVEDDFSKQVVGIGRWLKLQNGTKLYTTPPAAQRQPLTDADIKAVIRAGEYDTMEEFARAIEAAHGIGEKK